MCNSSRSLGRFLAVIGSAFCAVTAYGGVIQGVVINSVSSEFLSANDQRRATNLVNGSGLFGEWHTAIAAGSMWLTSPTTPSSVVSQASVTFDLGAVHTVNRMKVWNYNEAQSGANVLTRRGIKTCDILVAGEDQVFTTNVANQTFTRATGTFANQYDLVNMGGISARYVRINCRTNYNEGDFRVGLSKVLFIEDTAPVLVQSATRNFAGNRVTVQFSETVQQSSAVNVANYSIAGGTGTVAVVSAALNAFSNRVELATGQMDSNVVYTVTAQNVRDAANSVSVANTPVNIDPELVLWLKADAGVTADGGGLVTQWNDQSGFGNHALGTVAPSFVPSAANGMPAVHFDGTSQLMDIPSSSSLIDNGDLSVLAVISVDSLTTTLNNNVLSKSPLNQPASFDLQIVRTTGKPNFVRGNGSSSSSAQANAGLAANQFYIVEAVMRGTNGTFYLNGNFNGSGTHVAGLNDWGNSIRLGIRQDSGTKLLGNLAEAMLFRSAISDSERSQLESYLGTKYGISVVPLAITSQPANATRLVGQTASFSVTAIAGSPNLFYQWQKNSANIANATNALYTTPALALTDNNAAFRVLVYTALGITNTSDPATLTVLADNQPPSIYSATRIGAGATNVQVLFSEPVNSVSASTAGNFTLNNGATVIAAAPGPNSNVVVLTTSVLDPNSSYQLTAQNIKDAFNNTLVSASAAVLPGGAAVWLRADAGVLANGSGLISECADQTTNKNNALQYAAATRMPTLVPGAMNGLPAMRFDGASNYLDVASNPSIALTNDMTVYVAANFADYAVGREIMGKTLGNQPAPFDYYILNSTTLRFYRGNGTVNANIAGTTIPSAGQPHVLAVTMRGTAVTHFLDGAQNGSGTLSATIADAGTPLRIGSRADQLQYMKGDIAEVLVFGNALSDSDQKLVNTYLGVKYFPFTFVQQPADTNVLEGQTASFSVVASQGGASFRYQWQRGNLDIAGATNATYTTPTLTQGDSGATYRVTVFIPGSSSTNSTAATVTVAPDNVPPTISSAGKVLWNQTNIIVLFSEAVDVTTATQAANYSLDNGGVILSAVIGDAPNKVVLTTSPLNPSFSYTLTVQNVKDLFNNTIAPVSVPSGIYPPAVALWLRADAGVTADGSGLVSQWNDQSGNGNNVFQANGPTFMPTLVPSALNGLPVIRFDPANNGATNYLVCPSSPSVALVGDLTIYAVANFTDFTQNREIIGKTGGTGGNLPASFDYYAGTPNGFPLYRGNGSATGHANGAALPSAGVPHIISVVMQGTSVKHYLDGLTNGAGTVTAPMADNGDPLGIGTRSDLGQRMKGDIAELLLIGSAVSDSERVSLDSFLASKYALLIGPALRLSVATTGANSLTLSWPTPNLPFVLESTGGLAVPAWTTVTNSVSSTGGIDSVTVTRNAQQAYYRLRKL